MRYAYFHGFGSSPRTRKGVELARVFASHGRVLERPDLNRPRFETLSPAAALAEIDRLDAEAPPLGERWCVVGSSLGGWLAARWAELHPEKVHRLVLLCPGFDLAARWPGIVGPDAMERWRREGSLPFPDGEGRLRPVHWAFFEEGSRLPPRPVVPCPTLLFHGLRDETVPVETSRSYAAANPAVELVELDDVHALVDSLPAIIRGTLAHFGIGTSR